MEEEVKRSNVTREGFCERAIMAQATGKHRSDGKRQKVARIKVNENQFSLCTSPIRLDFASRKALDLRQLIRSYYVCI